MASSEYNRSYYQKNKERIKQQNTAYYKEHREQHRVASLAYKRRNKEKYKPASKRYYQMNKPEYFRRHIKARYGLTKEQYEMLCKRYPRCGICGKAKTKLCVDHDHITGAIRGMLCVKCNISLEWFQANKDNADLYLR